MDSDILKPQEAPDTNESQAVRDFTESKPAKPLFKPPKKSKSRWKRGNNVLCLLLTPGANHAELATLRKEENLLTYKKENQSFLIVSPPALVTDYKEKQHKIYVCDTERGVTISISFARSSQLINLFCDPKMVSNVFDETFVSRATGIKADWKQLVGIGAGGVMFGFITGLIF